MVSVEHLKTIPRVNCLGIAVWRRIFSSFLVSHLTSSWGDYGFSPPGGTLWATRQQMARGDLLGGYDADNPKITGATRELLDDPADLERNVKEQMDLRSMSYKQRRKGA